MDTIDYVSQTEAENNKKEIAFLNLRLAHLYCWINIILFTGPLKAHNYGSLSTAHTFKTINEPRAKQQRKFCCLTFILGTTASCFPSCTHPSILIAEPSYERF